MGAVRAQVEEQGICDESPMYVSSNILDLHRRVRAVAPVYVESNICVTSHWRPDTYVADSWHPRSIVREHA
jgi:hypothetical protein